MARAIHALSPRATRAFVEVNCAAIPGELIESELFGHMKGSFTGAFADRAGKFELADGGTLFLDEIGDMSLAAQAKVLRALEDGVVSRVGSEKGVAVDVRVIAATNKDLVAEIAAGRFREDLLYRLNVVPIEVPPLRARRGDIPAPRALRRGCLRGPRDCSPKRSTRRPSPASRRTTGRATSGSSGTRSSGSSSSPPARASRRRTWSAWRASRHEIWRSERGPAPHGCAPRTFEEFKQAAERAFLHAKLREHDWNVSETARTLDMPRSNLYKKIERYQLAREAS